MTNTAVLLINRPDRKGLVAGVSGLLYRLGANITYADQHPDDEAGLFFMRVEWILDGFDLSAFRAEFATMAAELQMQWQLDAMSEVPRVRVRVALRALRGGPVAPVANRGTQLRDSADCQQSPERRGPGAILRRGGPPYSGDAGDQERGGSGAAAACGSGEHRPDRARPLHADSVARLCGAVSAADHQRASLILAGVHGRAGRIMRRSSAA